MRPRILQNAVGLPGTEFENIGTTITPLIAHDHAMFSELAIVCLGRLSSLVIWKVVPGVKSTMHRSIPLFTPVGRMRKATSLKDENFISMSPHV